TMKPSRPELPVFQRYSFLTATQSEREALAEAKRRVDHGDQEVILRWHVRGLRMAKSQAKRICLQLLRRKPPQRRNEPYSVRSSLRQKSKGAGNDKAALCKSALGSGAGSFSFPLLDSSVQALAVVTSGAFPRNDSHRTAASDHLPSRARRFSISSGSRAWSAP